MARFAKPVSILVGLGFPTKIRSANGALIILDDWRHRRDETHEAATIACRDALLGRTTVEAARAAFVDFARTADILIEGTTVVPRAIGKTGRDAPA
jgi:hypothetical protein